ncbi:hypothetical protein K402DRAFT_388203 [Aulographum hederae CBS 113979]|uniref:RING-type domain-containing protein n=1 Tax=Aulographum hederae CBS 113979 TaxID=1176131 RepID=A0A6G1HH45_9PEZI|nr:hypothetical protein K402DRAFT_388203 [Aulographum hederae CBS 113979]
MERPERRELMFCHLCENEWYRDEHGLACPQQGCGSDFTEIIEEDHDPRAEEDAPPSIEHMLRNNPHIWGPPADPDEGDISAVQYHTGSPFGGGGHSFTYTSTSPMPQNRNQSPFGTGMPRAGVDEGIASNFFHMITGLINGAGRNNQNPQPQNPMGNTTGGAGFSRMPPNAGPGDGGFRFHYHTNTFVHPHGPQPNADGGFNDMQNVFETLMQNMAPPPPGHPAFGQDQHAGHFADPFATPFGPPGGGGMPGGPFANLLSALINPTNAAHGDAVYTQEAFDRVVTQLMEQNQRSNAPPRATDEDIASIPRVKVNKSMLGDSGSATCGICIDDATIGDEVMKLPCGHWYHEDCIAPWLRQSDSCPVCRKDHNGNVTNHNSSNPNSSGGGDAANAPPNPTGMPSPHNLNPNAGGHFAFPGPFGGPAFAFPGSPTGQQQPQPPQQPPQGGFFGFTPGAPGGFPATGRYPGQGAAGSAFTGSQTYPRFQYQQPSSSSASPSPWPSAAGGMPGAFPGGAGAAEQGQGQSQGQQQDGALSQSTGVGSASGGPSQGIGERVRGMFRRASDRDRELQQQQQQDRDRERDGAA